MTDGPEQREQAVPLLLKRARASSFHDDWFENVRAQEAAKRAEERAALPPLVPPKMSVSDLLTIRRLADQRAYRPAVWEAAKRFVGVPDVEPQASAEARQDWPEESARRAAVIKRAALLERAKLYVDGWRAAGCLAIRTDADPSKRQGPHDAHVGWEANGAMDIDGGSYDLRPDLDERPVMPPIPIKVPAKRHAILDGHILQRAVQASAAPRNITHVLEAEQE